MDAETGRIRYDRTKCTVCGRCEAVCPHYVNTRKGQSAEVDEILRQVAQDIPFYNTSGGGMTVSGGEPAAQPEGVLELIEKAGGLGIRSAMETCGIGTADFYRRAAELGCLFLYDIKGIDPEKHKRNTGVGVEKIHANLDALTARGASVVIRMPLVPGYNDSEEDLRLLADFLRARKGGYDYAEIMPYHDLGVEKLRSLGREADGSIPGGRAFAARWKEALDASGAEIRISGT
jgi:pyruvate formate lyase activating enzyme